MNILEKNKTVSCVTTMSLEDIIITKNICFDIELCIGKMSTKQENA